MGTLGDTIRVQSAKEVRDGIADFIDIVEQLIINAGASNAEIVVGRKSNVTGQIFDTIGHRIDGIDSQFITIAAQLISKLSKSDIQNLIGFADINKNLSKIDQTMLADTLLQQIAGTAPINAVPADGSITKIKLANGAVGIEKLSPDLFNDTLIQSDIEASFSNARSYENAYPMKFVYTIPAGLTLSNITAKCKFKTDSSNITQARLKLLVGTDATIGANLTTPAFTPITSGVETELTVTRSNSDTGFTNIVVFVYAWGSNIALPASYLISNLELYINGNLTEYTAVLDEAYSNAYATCTFNYTGDKLALERDVDSLNTDILNLNESVSKAIKSKVTDNLAQFSNGRTFENSYPLKFNCTVTKPYSTIEARVDITSKNANLFQGRLKIYFNNSPTDFVLGNFSTLTTGVEKNLSVIATRASIQTVTVYIFLEGTNVSLPSDYSFKDIKILLDGVEDDTITFTWDPTYGASDMTVTMTEGGKYILTDWNNNPVPLAVEADVENLKTKTIDTASSPLRGKILNMIGDSYVYGHTLGSDKVSYARIAVKYGMTYRNYGINGNTISTVAGGSGTPMVTRYVDMDNNADYIGVVGGRNDYNMGAPIGTNTDTDPSTFKGALNILCEGLINKYIGKKLFFITCWNVNDAMMAYSDAELEICGRWGIPCFDASRYSGVFMRSESFRTQYCLSSTDPSHLNEIGHEYVKPKFEAFLHTL
ncbi:SGNH/GDSL hydrolase family protein [Clostridium pasteurianum]|uniref:SGNH hydrolase-type esterase domain-containing protein n=1 Tax=Clostridium pasteurianum BC1 TaxID=86416 RepID=R4KCS1_CLOPA|nr:SGNH/GDSL hydrolase family protein [Clostridium pasteurianum]AGK97415.1 hypothetical protein Clopa_2555 [Clostridium pasteurianum BC1]